MSGHYQGALYLGDVSERVRILKNCGQSESPLIHTHLNRSPTPSTFLTQDSCFWCFWSKLLVCNSDLSVAVFQM